MAGFPRRRPRRQRIAVALAALAVVAICLFGELRYRPTGARRGVLWSTGIVAYALLLNAAIGPVIDHREPDRVPSRPTLPFDAAPRRTRPARVSRRKAAGEDPSGTATTERLN